MLSTIPPVDFSHPHHHPFTFWAIRPNTPVLPFGASAKVASFIDPSAKIVHGKHVLIGYRSFIAPFVQLNATTGLIKIGNNSNILDNATILSNPTDAKNPTTSVLIGDSVSIGYGATVIGPSTIGGYGASVAPTQIGPNALIDGATIEPGAIVSALARVGPGVTVPTGMRVLPGANVTTDAEASNPALGKVVPLTAADATALTQIITNNELLAQGYTQLYQGNSATGASPGVTISGVNNGNLAAVEGAGAEPGSANGPTFEPATQFVPTFIAPLGQQQPGSLFNFPARVTGQVNFLQRADEVAAAVGIHVSIRGDQGQPITFSPLGHLGNSVTITSPLTSSSTTGAGMIIHQNFQAGDNAVILGAAGANVNIGDNVSVGSGAVVTGTTIGDNVTIGARAYVANSTLQAGTVIPPGEIYINNKVVGTVSW